MNKSNRSVLIAIISLTSAWLSALPGIAAAQEKPAMANTAKDFSKALRLRGPKAVVADPQPATPTTQVWDSTTSSAATSLQPSTSAPTPAPQPVAPEVASVDYASIADQNYQTLVSSRPRAASLIHFNTNSATLKGDAYQILNELATALNGDLSDAVLMIVGHTDSQGAESYNIQLSRQRALSVKNYLINQGVNSRRLVAKGYGESYPIALNDGSDGRALNRRSEFIRID